MVFYNTSHFMSNPLAFSFLLIWIALTAFGTYPLIAYTEKLELSSNRRHKRIGFLIYWILLPAFVIVSGFALLAWNISS